VHEPLSPRAQELLLTQAIAAGVDYAFKHHPEVATVFVRRLDSYERWLKRLRISDEALVHFPERGRLVRQSCVWAVVAVLGAPVALYGWIHRLIPVALVRRALNRFAEPGKRKPQTAHITIIAGTVSFGLFYAIFVAVFHSVLGWPASLWYALSLPPSGLIAHYYVRNLRRLAAANRNMVILVRAPFAARRLLKMRGELVAEIEAMRPEIREHLQTAADPLRDASKIHST
jgi:hypothetical protein